MKHTSGGPQSLASRVLRRTPDSSGPRLDAPRSAPSPMPAGLVPGATATLGAEGNSSGSGVSSGFRWMSAAMGQLPGCLTSQRKL